MIKKPGARFAAASYVPPKKVQATKKQTQEQLPDAFELPARPTGYSIGYRFDGIPFDHEMLKHRSVLVKREVSQPTFGLAPNSNFGDRYPTTLSKTGVKYVTINIAVDLIHQELKV